MDVLNKLRNTVSNTITNTVNSTAYGLSQLSNVLPGNPVTREFEVTAHIASAGPGLLWKIYSGYKKSTRQEAAIFVFDKRILEKFTTKNEKEIVVETLKKGISQLTKLRHPQILIVQHPLEESRDCLAFATEPVFASLANILGNIENVSQPIPKNLKDFKLHDVEIRYGLFQLGEGLDFLHNNVKLLHRNLSPETIVINKNGAWKIFGFDLCELNQNPNDKQPNWLCTKYDSSIPMIVQPKLDFQAPECIISDECSPSSDIYSLGMLVYVLHSPDKQTNHKTHYDISYYRRLYTKSNEPNIELNYIPESLRNMILNNPQLRPDANQFIKNEYFMSIGMKTLNYLDKLFQWDNLQKSQFYKGLPQVIKQLPHRVILHRILPCLYKEFVNAPMIPFVLPSILQVLENCTTEEFNNDVLPYLKPVLAMEEPAQIGIVLMQRIDVILKLSSADVIKTDIIPMLSRALDSKMEQLQQLCLTALPSISTIIDGPSMKNIIIVKVQKICTEQNSSLSLRVNCLLCVAKMLENLDRWIVTDQVIPFLQKIPHNGDPAILMAIIGIYKKVLTHSKLGISKEILASKVLPFILPLLIEQRLSLSQFETIVSLINDMVTQVTNEQRDALRQLDSVRRDAQELNDALQQTMNSSINISNSINQSENISTILNTSSLSLKNEKSSTSNNGYGLVKEQEMQYRSQLLNPSIQNIEKNSIKIEPKDLTSTLLQNNLTQLNLSSKDVNKNKSIQLNYSSQTSSTWNQNQIQQQLPTSSIVDIQKTNLNQWNPINNSKSLPNNQNYNLNTIKSQQFSVATNQIRSFEPVVGKTLKNHGNTIDNNQLIKEQQTDPIKLSNQDIIDFLS